MEINQATKKDIPSLLSLLNRAYRGEESKKGWTTEANLLEGEIRTDEESLEELFSDSNSTMFKCTEESGEIVGCVHLKKTERGLYLGMLSVSPTLQGKGIGKMFLKKSDDYARIMGCDKIYMQVISVRNELNDWYMRHGYKPTGETFPFDVDEKYGVKTQPFDFIILEKKI